MLKIYFHTLPCICWLLLPYLIAQCTVTDHVKPRLVTFKEQVTTVGYAVAQHSGCAEICVRNSPAEFQCFTLHFFNSIIDKHQHMHFTFNNILV